MSTEEVVSTETVPGAEPPSNEPPAPSDENRLEMPRGEDDKEGYDRLYKTLGRPDAPEGYELASLVGEGESDPAFMNGMAQAMHEAGLSTSQAHKLTGAYQQFYEKALEEAGKRHQAEWAEAEEFFNSNDENRAVKEQALRGFRLFDLPDEDAKRVSLAIEGALGVKSAVELFARIGKKLGEDQPVGGARPMGSDRADVDPADILYPNHK